MDRNNSSLIFKSLNSQFGKGMFLLFYFQFVKVPSAIAHSIIIDDL